MKSVQLKRLDKRYYKWYNNTGHTHNKTAGSHDRRHPPNERRQGKPWRLLSILHGGSSKAVCSSGSDRGSMFQLCSPRLSMMQTTADILKYIKM